MPTPTPAPTPTPTPVNVTFTTTGRNGVTITNDEQRAIVLAGTNNVLDGTDPLDGYLARGGAAQVAAFDASTLSPFLMRTGFIGAVDPGNPASFDDWTCTKNATPVTAAASCTNPVSRTGSSPCPDGTTRVSTLQSGIQPGPNDYGCLLPAQVTGSLRLSGEQVYVLREGVTRVGVDIGAAGTAGGQPATLTVDPGTLVIRQDSRSSPVLAISRGSRIFVNGTRAQPVIFNYQIALVIAGRAPISDCQSGTSVAAGTCENRRTSVDGNNSSSAGGGAQIAAYGGTVADDSSGGIHYLQLLSPGFDPGLELFGVGSGTLIDHVAITGANAEAVLIDGGGVNLSYLFATQVRDAVLSVGQGWRGSAQFVIGVQRNSPVLRSGWVLNADNPQGDDVLPRIRGTLVNYTFVQPGGDRHPGAILLANGVDFTLANGIVKTTLACVSMAASTDANGGKSTIRPAGGTDGVPTTIDENGPPRFYSNYFACLGR